MDSHPAHLAIQDLAIEALRRSQHLVVFTGAGVSAESGIPTFREKRTGLWENLDFRELATPAAFAGDPTLVWGWYEWRRAIIVAATPNAAHTAIVAMSRLVPKFTLVTQNVDDLHERAGSSGVLHVHGEIARPFCSNCAEAFHTTHSPQMGAVGGARREPPRCLACGSQVRPGVVWFGESLPAATWHTAQAAARLCDVFLCCGTSAVVQPAASLVDIALGVGAFTIQVNLDATPLDDVVDVTLGGLAGSILPQLAQAMSPQQTTIGKL